MAKNILASKDRKQTFDHGKCDRKLCVGELVLMRVPGLHGALESSWEGTYRVVRVVSRVTYFVKRDGGGHERLVHINNLKVYRPRPASVTSVCVVAEDTGAMEAALHKENVLGEELCRI